MVEVLKGHFTVLFADMYVCIQPFYVYLFRSLVAQMVKRLSTMRETWVQSLGWGESLEKEMAPHSSTLAWKIPWMEDPGRLQFMGHKELDTTE